MSDDLIKRVIADLEDFPLPLCESYMYEGIRHLVRNCGIVECRDEYHQGDCIACNRPSKHDGERMARLLNAIPDLVNEIARLKKAV